MLLIQIIQVHLIFLQTIMVCEFACQSHILSTHVHDKTVSIHTKFNIDLLPLSGTLIRC